MEAILKLSAFDLMAPPVTLYLRGHTSIKTIFGLIMTVCYVVFSCSFALGVGITFFDTKEPMVTQQSAETGVFPRIDLSLSNMFPVVYVLNNLKNIPPKDIERYVTVTFSKQKFVVNKDLNDDSNIEFKQIPMRVMPCSELMQNTSAYRFYKEYDNSAAFRNFAKNYGLCIQVNETEAFVQGGGIEPNLDILSLEIFPCSLSSGCANFSEMAQVSIVIGLPNYSLNLSNYEQPAVPFLAADRYYSVDPKSSMRYSSKLRINEVHDDRGFLLDTNLRQTFIEVASMTSNQKFRDPTKISCTPSQIARRACLSYLNFDFYSTGQREIIFRRYKTVIQALSEFGGINSFLFMFFSYATVIYTNLAKKRILVDSVFDFLSDKQVAKHSSSSEPALGELKNRNSLRKDPLLKNAREKAFKAIEENLDILTMVKEVNNLKVLTRILMQDYHLRLVPLVTLNYLLREKEPSKTSSNQASKKQENKSSKMAPLGKSLLMLFAADPRQESDPFKVATDTHFKQVLSVNKLSFLDTVKCGDDKEGIDLPSPKPYKTGTALSHDSQVAADLTRRRPLDSSISPDLKDPRKQFIAIKKLSKDIIPRRKVMNDNLEMQDSFGLTSKRPAKKSIFSGSNFET